MNVGEQLDLIYAQGVEAGKQQIRAELAKERETRVKYQSVVYDCCNRLDAAFSRSVRGGEGTTIDQVAPDISFLNRLRLEAIAKTEAAEAQVASVVEFLNFLIENPNRSFDSMVGSYSIAALAEKKLQSLPDYAAKYQAVVDAAKKQEEESHVSYNWLEPGGHVGYRQICEETNEAVRQLKEETNAT